jgi:hypothetical protein
VDPILVAHNHGACDRFGGATLRAVLIVDDSPTICGKPLKGPELQALVKRFLGSSA